MRTTFIRPCLVPLFSFALTVNASACSGGGEGVLYIGGIPDQNVALLETRFGDLADYLSRELDLPVVYVPSIDYAAVVIGFRNNDIHLGWFGGLTGVQARLAAPGALAIAQRPRDMEFRSVFVADPSLGLTGLPDVAGRTLTFGSESSTSGHLMPRFFLIEAGVDPGTDIDGPPSYAGSHDTTWKLVESGAFQVGALNEGVWEARLAAGEVDRTKVDVFYRSPHYYDYHWVVRGDLDESFGDGTTDRVRRALLAIDVSNGGRAAAIAEAFQTGRFIPTTNENYEAIEDIAVGLGIIER